MWKTIATQHRAGATWREAEPGSIWQARVAHDEGLAEIAQRKLPGGVYELVRLDRKLRDFKRRRLFSRDPHSPRKGRNYHD